jgi:hypothetical protein
MIRFCLFNQKLQLKVSFGVKLFDIHAKLVQEINIFFYFTT